MTEKRYSVKALLAKYCLSYIWLVRQLCRKGVNVTPNELCQFITGRRRGEKADKVVELSYQILFTYSLFEDAVFQNTAPEV